MATRKIARLLQLTLISFGCFACQSSNFSREDQQSVADDVRQTLDSYYSAINSSGLTAEFHYLDSPDNFFWVPPGYSKAISYDSVVIFIKQNAPLFRSINNMWDTLRIIPLTKELASYTGKLHSVMTDTSGKTTTYSLIETGVMIKRSDGWKILNGQTAMLPG